MCVMQMKWIPELNLNSSDCFLEQLVDTSTLPMHLSLSAESHQQLLT